MNQDQADMRRELANLHRTMNSVKELVLGVEKEMKRRFDGVDDRLDRLENGQTALATAVKNVLEVQDRILKLLTPDDG